jgi:DNA-directed RNA polymerase specialized sigma24 family protein
MRAMVMLQLHAAQVAADDTERAPLRPELLLADAGFNSREISTMLGKSSSAVAKAITRGRAARRGTIEVIEPITSAGVQENA